MAAPLGLPQPHRQQWLAAIERLDLRLLIDAQHQGMVGRIEVKPDNVTHLGDNQRVSGQLESLQAVRLQPEGTPDPPDARSRDARVPGHAARTPMRGSRRSALQCLHDDVFDLRIVDFAGRSRPRLVEQPVQAVLDKAPAPLPDGLRGYPFVRRHRLVAQPSGTAQHDARPQRQCLRRLAPLRVALRMPAISADISILATGRPVRNPTPDGKSGKPAPAAANRRGGWSGH